MATVYANESEIAEINLKRARGDTKSDVFEVKQKDGSALDITGYTFKLTVNSEKNPTGITNQLYSLSGAIVDAAAGTVGFAPSAVEADQTPGTYFYDVEMTDPGGRKSTKVKGKYRYVQDISK